jgi:hypothetical protein
VIPIAGTNSMSSSIYGGGSENISFYENNIKVLRMMQVFNQQNTNLERQTAQILLDSLRQDSNNMFAAVQNNFYSSMFRFK